MIEQHPIRLIFCRGKGQSRQEKIWGTGRVGYFDYFVARDPEPYKKGQEDCAGGARLESPKPALE